MKKSKDEIQDEALKVILPLKKCGVALSMGVGKTLIGLKHMNANYTDYAKFLVVVPKKSVINEWKNQASQFGLEHLLPHMHFSTYRSLTKQNTDYDVLYLDEAHNILPNMTLWLGFFSGKILGLSGTWPKSIHSIKYKILDEFCPVAYKYSTDSAVEDSILNNYKIIVYKIALDEKKTIKVEKGGKSWYTSEVASYDYWCGRLNNPMISKKDEQILRVMRMKALMDFPKKERLTLQLMNTISDKCIIFANTQKQADRLCSHTYHSNNKNSEKNLELFSESKITKLACVLQLSEGINIKDLKEAIVLHSYSNERKLSQRLGRTLRLKPNETAINRILCYKDTVDESWVEKALEDFDSNKITTLYV